MSILKLARTHKSGTPDPNIVTAPYDVYEIDHKRTSVMKFASIYLLVKD